MLSEFGSQLKLSVGKSERERYSNGRKHSAYLYLAVCYVHAKMHLGPKEKSGGHQRNQEKVVQAAVVAFPIRLFLFPDCWHR